MASCRRCSSEPGTVIGFARENPETDAVMSAAQTILDFKTETARDIEAARIKSIIDPRLADPYVRAKHRNSLTN